MTQQQTLARTVNVTAPLAAAGIRVSGIVHRVFSQRTQPLIAWDIGPDDSARDFTLAYGITGELQEISTRMGNGFISMSEALLSQLAEPLPELDAVILAYHSPDLFHADVAGFYLSQRLPGSPVPWSVAETGPGAGFTALRITDGMRRMGELDHGALFVYDQNAAMSEPDDTVSAIPDAAVLLTVGGTGGAVVSDFIDARTSEPGDPTAAGALAAAMARHGVGTGPTAILTGAGLAAALAGTALADRVQVADADAQSTGVWAALASRWPISEPVLVADHDPVGGMFRSCLLCPEAGR
jgi:hypothetical protein